VNAASDRILPASIEPIAHGGALAKAIALYGGQREDWLDLSTGINPCPPSMPDIPRHLWQVLPDTDSSAKCLAAARSFYAVPPQAAIIAAPGVQALIQLLPQLRPHKSAVVLAPTYSEYEHVFQRFGSGCSIVDSWDNVPKNGIVVIVNPNNPTGRIVPREGLLAIAKQCAAQGGLLIVDEAFCDVAPSVSIADFAGMDGLLILKSFGKFFGLAGIRLGFAIGTQPDIDRLASLLGPWAVSGPALHVGAGLMGEAGLHKKIAAQIDNMASAQSAAGLEIIADVGLFQLIKIDNAHAWHDHLARRHILTRAFDGHPHWLRFGLCPDEASRGRLANALSTYV
jgi:cobalamin biosynthesis protein CobC